MKTLLWPRQTPLQRRKSIDPGPRCFAVDRKGDSPLFQRQRIRLAGNLFLLALTGGVVFECEGQRVAVNEGGACFACPGEFILSEIPDRVGRFRSHLIFFNRAMVKQVVKRDAYLSTIVSEPRERLFWGVFPLKGRSTEHLCHVIRTTGTPPDSLLATVAYLMGTSASSGMFLRTVLLP